MATIWADQIRVGDLVDVRNDGQVDTIDQGGKPLDGYDWLKVAAVSQDGDGFTDLEFANPDGGPAIVADVLSAAMVAVRRDEQ